jgi:hypothetical protein
MANCHFIPLRSKYSKHPVLEPLQSINKSPKYVAWLSLYPRWCVLNVLLGTQPDTSVRFPAGIRTQYVPHASQTQNYIKLEPGDRTGPRKSHRSNFKNTFTITTSSQCSIHCSHDLRRLTLSHASLIGDVEPLRYMEEPFHRQWPGRPITALTTRFESQNRHQKAKLTRENYVQSVSQFCP